MSAELPPDLQLEIAHLLLIDVVGYSKLLVNEQIESLQQLNRIVRATNCFRAAEARDKLIRLPTGDGMALIFFESPEQSVRCALEIAEGFPCAPEFPAGFAIPLRSPTRTALAARGFQRRSAPFHHPWAGE